MTEPSDPVRPLIGLGTTRAMPQGFLAVLTRLGSTMTLPANTDLFREGDSTDALFVLRKGRLEVSVLSEEGRKLTMNVLGAGMVFGEVGLIDGGPRSATVTAMEPTELLRIERRTWLAELRRNPDFALDTISVCVERLRWVNSQLVDQVFHPLPVRLARRLLHLAGDQQGKATLNLSQSALADHVGASREAVARVISDWKAAGILTPGRGRITLHDPDALRAISQGFDPHSIAATRLPGQD